MIPFFVPEFTKDMENAAIDALRNEKFVMGESVTKFEEEFARYIGTKYAISVNSGNSALQLSLLSLNIAAESKSNYKYKFIHCISKLYFNDWLKTSTL